MTVRIRLEADDVDELDAHEAALRTVLAIPTSSSPDYRNHRRGGDRDNASRRFLESDGVQTGPAAAGGTGGSPLAIAEDFKRRRDLAGEIGALTAADADLQRRPWFPLQPGDVVLMHMPADAHGPAFGETFLAVHDDTDIAGNAMLRRVSCSPSLALDDPDDDPEYLLRYDENDQRWVIDSRDLGEQLKRWLGATSTTHRDQVEEAQAFAAGEISDVEDPRKMTGWQEISGRGWAPVFDDDETLPAGQELTPFYELWFEAGPGMLTVIRAGVVVHGRPATTTAVVSR